MPPATRGQRERAGDRQRGAQRPARARSGGRGADWVRSRQMGGVHTRSETNYPASWVAAWISWTV